MANETNSPDSIAVAERVRELMSRHGIGKRQQTTELCRILDLSFSQGHRKLRGNSPWTLSQIKKVAEVDHKELGRQLLSALASFQAEPSFREVVGRLSKDMTLRDSFRSLVTKMGEASNLGNVIGDAEGFRSSKRGRRPSFQKSGKTRIMYQIRFLGQQSVAKAS